MNILLGTRLRMKLLAYVFTHNDTDFYVRELAGIIGEDVGNLSRELKKLEVEGLFRSFTRGRAKYYSLNKEYPLYNELKSIVFKTVGVEGSLRELVSRYDGISDAFIYGSYATGEEGKGSDIDLVLIGEYPPGDFIRHVRELESRLGREINFTSYNPAEFAAERAKKGGFLNVVLKGKIIILKGAIPNGKAHTKA